MCVCVRLIFASTSCVSWLISDFAVRCIDLWAFLKTSWISPLRKLDSESAIVDVLTTADSSTDITRMHPGSRPSFSESNFPFIRLP